MRRRLVQLIMITVLMVAGMQVNAITREDMQKLATGPVGTTVTDYQCDPGTATSHGTCTVYTRLGNGILIRFCSQVNGRSADAGAGTACSMIFVNLQDFCPYIKGGNI